MTLLNFILFCATLALNIAATLQFLHNRRRKEKLRMSPSQYRRLLRITIVCTGLMLTFSAGVLALVTRDPGLSTIASGVLIMISCVLYVAQSRLDLQRTTVVEGWA